MKIRTLEKLETSMTSDLTWRKRELTTLKFMIKGATENKKTILHRAAIALLYSHWEGHVKYCSLVYLNYLNSLGLNCDQLSDNFIQLNLSSQFDSNISLKSTKNQQDIHKYFSRLPEYKFRVAADKTIDTKSNLNSEVLFNILSQLGLSSDAFELKSTFIDKVLLKTRNEVVHGQVLKADSLKDTYHEIEEELLELIQTFHNLVNSAAANSLYLKQTIQYP